MTRFSDLSWDLVEEILLRVPITCLGRVRSTCKPWKDLCKDQRFKKRHCSKAAKEFLVVMAWSDSTKSSRSLGLHDIKDLPSVKEIGEILGKVKILDVVCQCDGLLLCVTNFRSRLVLCNPYMVQTRWIELSDSYYSDYCLYAMGHDDNNNYKVLRHFYDYRCSCMINKIYDLKSNSWRVLDITFNFYPGCSCVSLKGYTYFVGEEETSGESFVISFDFTTERFGPRMYFPCHSGDRDIMVPSCIREEQLAVLNYKRWNTYELEIWVTTKIEPDAASWSKFFKVDFRHQFQVCSFFIVGEKKIAVVSGSRYEKGQSYDTSYVVGENGSYEETGFNGAVVSYVPSSVLIQ